MPSLDITPGGQHLNGRKTPDSAWRIVFSYKESAATCQAAIDVRCALGASVVDALEGAVDHFRTAKPAVIPSLITLQRLA